MTGLHAMGLTVVRGGRAILRDASLDVLPGECVVVIGANGAGKSTLLSVLAGLLKPDSGTVAFGGQVVGVMPGAELARRRAYLPQNPRCEWPISVERLVALGLTPVLPAFGPLPSVYDSRIAAALVAFDLEAYRAQEVTTLSGGELARAMLARALVGDPDILIVDEPISGLDPRHALDTMTRLRMLADSGKLVVASVHDLTLAARYATRICAIHQGRIVADGAPGDILTGALLRSIFDVEARVSGSGMEMAVDYRKALATGRDEAS